MSPEDKAKYAAAYRRAIDRHPDADKPLNKYIDGVQQTPRTWCEVQLAGEQVYDEVDAILAMLPDITLDEFIEMSFGPQPKDEPAPPASQPKPKRPPQRNWKI